MKITTLIAAVALATASTSAVADQVNVTTDAGEIVMIEKSQVLEPALIPVIFSGVLLLVASSSSGTGT